jgi:hypothetical protein
MPKEVLPQDVKQVMDVTSCTPDRARRELELHSVEVAINNIFDNPHKFQKIDHPAASASPPRNSAFTSSHGTPSQGTMVHMPLPAPKGTFAAIPQTPLIENINQSTDMSEEEQMKLAMAASLETAQAPASDVVGSVSDQV